MIAQLWILQKVGMIIGSFLAGLLFFYGTSPLQKEMKKILIKQVVSLLINLVLYIWAAKILLHTGRFIRDPLAVLAYPSDSYSLYVAIVFLFVHVSIQVLRKYIEPIMLGVAFVPTFLAASFVYEFIQFSVLDNILVWDNLALLGILLIIYLLYSGRRNIHGTTIFLFYSWCVGKLLLSIVMPYTTVYGYMLTPWFLIAFMVGIMIWAVIVHNKLS